MKITYIDAINVDISAMNASKDARADIVPYSSEFDQTVFAWIDSEETYRNVCRGRGFPPPPDMISGWQRNDVKAYLLFSNTVPVAYGELWDRPHEMAMEIAHLIVDPFRRNKGFGSKMVELLYQRAASRPAVARVLLNLYSENEIALACYLKAGFELVSTANYVVGLKLVRSA